MRYSRYIFLMAAILALAAGCSPANSGGDSGLLDAARQQIESLQGQVNEWKAKAEEFQQQVKELSAQAELTGATDRETAENIVRRYHETHTYSKTDLFVCADMAKDVWNMLQTKGINAVIQIGGSEKAVTQMQDSDHAWVLAEVAPGEMLALETTNGHSVEKSENPLYYTGWSFENPQEYDEFEKLKHEHNIRVEVYNSLAEERNNLLPQYQQAAARHQSLVDEFNSKYAGQAMSDPAMALYEQITAQLGVVKELEGRINQIDAMLGEQQAALEQIPPKMQALAQ